MQQRPHVVIKCLSAIRATFAALAARRPMLTLLCARVLLGPELL